MQLCQKVDNTLVINPGSLAQGYSGGSYCKINIYSNKHNCILEACLLDNICERTRVVIEKI